MTWFENSNLTFFSGTSIQDSITPTSPVVHAKVNEKVTISCKYQYTVSMNNLQWYRHYLDSTLEFLVLIMQSGQNQTATPPHPRLTASVDKDNKLVNLEIFPADVEDSATYYCALQPTVAGNAWTPYKNLLRAKQRTKCFRSGVYNPTSGELPLWRFQLQSQSNTPEPANQGVQGYLIISDRCVSAGLELKFAGR